tara:strand:+ start:3453 stop:3731 length:279 start_codon:yes stop_codon:yes gene_type:complete
MKNKLTKVLMEDFSPVYLKVVDQSHLHAGHYENTTGYGTHFDVTLVSNNFKEIKKLERHRLIYQSCKPLFVIGIHALSLHVYDLDEWSKENG